MPLDPRREERAKDDIVPVPREIEERCPFCNALLCVGNIGRGSVIEFRCRRCKEFLQIIRV